MSIVTLKKKTQTQYNNMSVNSKHGFSLNGTLRNQGYVGQTNAGRSLTRTLFRGGAPKGYGGCCGEFLNYPLSNSALTSLNDIKVIKPTVVNASKLIETKYPWFKRPYPCTSVKPDNNQNLNTQGQHVKNLALSTIKCSNLNKPSDASLNEVACTANINYNPFFRTPIYSLSKPRENYTPIPSSEYILRLEDKCTQNNKIFIPSNTNNGVLPGPSASY